MWTGETISSLHGDDGLREQQAVKLQAERQAVKLQAANLDLFGARRLTACCCIDDLHFLGR